MCAGLRLQPEDASTNKRGCPQMTQMTQISRRGDVTVNPAHPNQDNYLRNLRIKCLTRPKSGYASPFPVAA